MNKGQSSLGDSGDSSNLSTKDFLASREVKRSELSPLPPFCPNSSNDVVFEDDSSKKRGTMVTTCPENLNPNAQMVKDGFVNAFGKSAKVTPPVKCSKSHWA